MLHPLLRLAADQPSRLVEHLFAYGELAGDELEQAASRLQRRLAWHLAALGLAAVALTLAGVATLFWAALPPTAIAAPQALWQVPLIPALAALLCALAGRTRPPGAGFQRLRERLAADGRSLHEAADGAASTNPLSCAASMTGDAADQALRPIAERHPLTLVGAAAAGGALLVWAQPWRALAGSALIDGALSRLGARLAGELPIASLTAALQSLLVRAADPGHDAAAPSYSGDGDVPMPTPRTPA